jgi:hypothetical protein
MKGGAMKGSTSGTTKAAKRLFEVKTPLRTRAYKSKFIPFESTKFLDVAAVRAAKKAVSLEVGTIEAAGYSLTVAAEIKDGEIVRLRPLHCPGCEPAKSNKPDASAFKKTVAALNAGLEERGLLKAGKPVPLVVSPRLEIPIGPIVVIIGDPGTGTWDFCIEITIGRTTCWWCLRSARGCMTLGPPLP